MYSGDNNAQAAAGAQMDPNRMRQRLSEIEQAGPAPDRPHYKFDGRYDDPRMKPTGKTPLPDSQSEQVNHWPELESILKGNEDITRSLVDEVFRLRQLLANERLDRRMEQEQAMKLLGMITEHARTPFLPPENVNPSTKW